MTWQHAANPLKELVFRLAGEKYKNLVEIALLWEDLVGPLLAERSFISHLDQNVLFVSVTNSTWMQEYVLLKQPLITKLHEKGFTSITDIVFVNKSKQTKRKVKNA
jgi:hypothetical protein